MAPLPKTRFTSDSSGSICYSTHSSAHVPRTYDMQDSGDESDDVYDQFDLGGFTKEEIKRYEAMVGPGERLRDAVPSQELSGSARGTAADPNQDLLGTSVTSKLPEELHEMLRAGLLNAIYRVLGEADLLRFRGFSHDTNGENEIDDVVGVFWEELAKPAPQMECFIRRNQLRKTTCLHREPNRMELLVHRYGPWISVEVAHRILEQQVYDFGRLIGLSKEQATRHVMKVREDSSKCNIDLLELGDYESSQCENLLMYLAIRKPELLTSIKEPDDLRYVSENGKAEIERRLVKSNPKGAKQVKCYLRTLKDHGPHSEYDKVMSRFWFLGAEPFVNNISGLREDTQNVETADKTRMDETARKDGKKAYITESGMQKEARRQAEKEEGRIGDQRQAGRPNYSRVSTSESELQSKAQRIEDREKPAKSKTRGNKRKSEPGPPVQSDVLTEQDHKHKKSRVVSDAQDSNSEKSKRKKRGPQHSPFFQRSHDPEVKKKDAVSVTAAVEGSSSEKKPQPAEFPPIHIKKGVPMAVHSPSSDDSSPLSSLRSTPSLPLDIEELETDNKRRIESSYKYAGSEPAVSARMLRNDPTSPISLLDLNKRLLDGTIYRDGIVLAKLEPPATIAGLKKEKKRPVTVSPFFTKSPSKKPTASDKLSCIPFPPLHATSFGLVQERLSHDPFRLLIAVIFLNKTRGFVALPVFFELMERYPTPADLAAANQEDVVQIIQHLGLQNQRAKKCINLAKAWLERPPEKGTRYRVLHYPKKDDGNDVRPGEIIGEEDERVAWEIGQLPGIGVYAIDSWRIFCRDELRGLPNGLPNELTPEAKEEELQKEWTRVLAGDKELRAYLRWRWLRNGWEWDPVTGERKKVDEGELAKVGKGGIIYEGNGGDMVIGRATSEGPEAVKAELEIGEKHGEDIGGVENLTAGPTTRDAPELEGEEAEATTSVPQHSNDVAREQDDGKVTADKPET